jgi:menaquinone-9 beta-reductase
MQPDVVIVGAGTAGAAAAALLAERGLRVVCLEQRALDEAGARWVNGVPEWTFDESGIEPPRGEELRGRGHAFHIVSGWGPQRVVLREQELLEVDMRLLVARLQQRAGARAHVGGAAAPCSLSAEPRAARGLVAARREPARRRAGSSLNR